MMQKSKLDLSRLQVLAGRTFVSPFQKLKSGMKLTLEACKFVCLLKQVSKDTFWAIGIRTLIGTYRISVC